MLVNQIKISSNSSMADIIGGYIRFSENKELSNNKKNVAEGQKTQVDLVNIISADIYENCEKSDIMNRKIFKFQDILIQQNNSEISSYYEDAILFLKNYTVHTEILSNYIKFVNKSKTDGLYEFLLKIRDIINGDIQLRKRSQIALSDKTRKESTCELLEIELSACDNQEIILEYSKIGIPNNLKEVFWWDKEIISKWSKTWTNYGYQVKRFDNKEKIVTFERFSSDFEYSYELSEKDIKETKLHEGAYKKVLVNKYERSSKARKQCISHYGCKCRVCGFDFEEFYGKLGTNYIEVHHIKPLSEIKVGYEVDPIRDLITVCSNCHSIIHKKNPPYKVEELKRIIEK